MISDMGLTSQAYLTLELSLPWEPLRHRGVSFRTGIIPAFPLPWGRTSGIYVLGWWRRGKAWTRGSDTSKWGVQKRWPGQWHHSPRQWRELTVREAQDSRVAAHIGKSSTRLSLTVGLTFRKVNFLSLNIVTQKGRLLSCWIFMILGY